MGPRRSKPLLRASVAAVGTALLGCTPGVADSPKPTKPSVEAAPPVELADTRELQIVVVVPPDTKMPRANPMLVLTTVDGTPISQRSMVLHSHPDGIYTTTWSVNPGLELPKRVSLSIVVPFDDDPEDPSRGDWVAEVTGVVGEPMRLEPKPYMPVVTAVLEPHSTKPVDPLRAQEPVYANTKGSHHYQDRVRPPVELLQIDLEGPNDPSLREVSVRLVFENPGADELRATVTVPRLPAEIHLTGPGDFPARFQVFVDAGPRTDVHHTARMDSMKGDVLRAVLRKP